jgi:hypothetical protein
MIANAGRGLIFDTRAAGSGERAISATIFATELPETARYRTILDALDTSRFTNKIRVFGIKRDVAILLQTLFKTGALNHSATLPFL